MQALEINGVNGISTIYVGEDIKNLGQYIPTENVVIITDTNVWDYYKQEFPECNVIKIGTGEQIKTLQTVEYIYKRLLELGADRSSFIVGIGGGVVCDIAGFAASTYLRGVPFGFVPSTLLSQVDAGVGGKNGVNFAGYKNIVGVFNQPEFVICDLNMLRTLPENEILSGFGEIVKHALIADSELFTFLDVHAEEALALKTTIIERLVYDSVVIKSSIVNRDEKETGERRKLNFGHTFGHAIEKVTGISHGAAVSVGMVIACNISIKKKLLSPEDTKKIIKLLKKLKLPTKIDVDRAMIIDALSKDKKREKKNIFLSLLKRVGGSVIIEVPFHELEQMIGDFFSHSPMQSHPETSSGRP